MDILYITNQDPTGVGGGSFASHAFLKAFSEICEGIIDICIADSCKELDPLIKYRNLYRVKPRSKIRRLLSMFSGELHRYTDFVRRLLEKNNYDVCVLDHSLLCKTLMPLLKNKGMKIIVIHHNFEREYFADNIESPLKKLFLLRHYVNSERIGYQNSDLNLFLTEYDLNKSEQVYGKTRSLNRLIGTFLFADNPVVNFIGEESSKTDGLTYVITGAMDVHQGVEGVLYFLKNLYQHLPQNARLIIAGRSPAEVIRRECGKHINIELIPNPSDMDAILSEGDVYICPTREGGGLKLRVMDGLKKGMPVIVHTKSARGYDMFYNSTFFMRFCSEEEFKDCIDQIEKRMLNKEISKKDVIATFDSFFSYKAGKKRIERFVSECLNLAKY